MNFDQKLVFGQLLRSTEVFVFDFDDTLVDERFSVVERWNVVLRKYQTVLNCSDLVACFFDIFDREGIEYKGHVDDMLGYLNLDMAYKNEIVQDFLSQRSSRELVFPRVIDLLTLLTTNNIKVALFTNGLRYVQEHRVKVSGLKSYFSHIQYGDCAGKKPNSSAFLHLSECLNLTEMSKLTMIGDSFIDDYQGASAVGANCILVNTDVNDSLPVPIYTRIDELYFDFTEAINKGKLCVKES